MNGNGNQKKGPSGSGAPRSNGAPNSGGMPPRNGGMTPRERYFAAQRENEERERRQAAEAEMRAAENARRAELARQKRIYEEKKRRERERELRERKRQVKVFGGRFLLFLLMFALIFGIVALGIFISFKFGGGTAEGGEEVGYTFVFLENADADPKNSPKWEQSKTESNENGVRYVNFTKLAELLDMTVTGSADERRFITADGGEEVSFTVGSPIAEVNSFSYRMHGEAKEHSRDNVYIPLSFITDCMTGISVTDGEDGETVNLMLTAEKVTFLIKPMDTVGPIPENSDIGSVTETEPGDTDEGTDTDKNTDPEGGEPADGIPAVEFKSDLSSYEEYMDPADRDGYLILVNKWNTLGADDIPDDLTGVVNTRNDGRNTQKLRLYAAKALEALFIELYACGYDDVGPSGYPVSVMSAYRAYTYQEQLFNSYVDREMKNDPSLTREEAEKEVESFSARPGTSEHQTGLCIDMHNLSSAQKAFANEEAYEWLRENCWKFGFILRFPDGKTGVTGITFEPWHYRYVGRYHAYRIHELDMCLEEYLEYIG